MLNADTKRIINNARDILVGKVPNPQSQVDLITIAMIYKFMDDMDLAGLELAGKRTFFVGDLEKYAFSKLLDPKLGNQGRMNLYAEALEQLPLAASVPELFRTIFRGAFLPFRDPQTLTMFLKEINNFSYDNSENIGNAFEYLLSIMGAQGDAGQFRTPRHIIDFIVDVVKPQKDETILDPACGTAGFLISAYLYIKNHNKDLSTTEMQTLNDNVIGYDISPDMRKLALVNLYLHKFADPNIYEYDTLTSEERWNDKFDVILANPPFMTPKGGIVPHNRFGVQANKSEVLFVDYIAEHLNLHGRAGIIVPEGIIFQGGTAYKKLRKMLVDENYLYAVVSLPAGIFNPYAGVKTSILFLDKQLAKAKDEILFVKVENDGYDLGAQRREIKKNDLPAALDLLEQFKAGKEINSPLASIVEKEKIRENGEYNLTAGRYQNDICFNDCKYDFVKIGDIAEYIRGITFAKKDQIYDGDISAALPVATTKAAQEDGVRHNDLYFIPKTLLKSDRQILRDGDILISIANSLSLLGRITPIEKRDEGISFGAFMGLLRADSTKILPKFLLYLLKSDTAKKYFHLHANTTTNISNLTSSDILAYEIPLPPMEIQRQIVEEIENKQQAINHAIEIRKNLERERLYFGNLLAGIDYTEVKLGEIADIISGQSPEGKYYNQTGEGMPFYQGRTEFGKRFIGNPKTWTTNTTKTANIGDILMSVRAPVGPVNICGLDEICIGRGLAAIRVGDKAKMEYVYGFLKSIENTITGSGGAVFDSINRAQIADIKIPLPSIADQERIVAQIEAEESVIRSMDNLIEIMHNKIDAVLKRIYKD